MEILKNINTWFWNEHFWLPPNITWDHISDTSTVNYAQFSDLHNGFKVALAILVVRYVLERYLFSPIGSYFGLKPKDPRRVNCETTENKVLEKAFTENRKISYKQVQGLAKQLDWSERRVEIWIRRRLSSEKPSTLSKFTECAWRFTFYLCSFCYGLYTLWDKPWLWSTNHCWYDYPHHSVTDDVWWYYMLQLGFYWSLTVSQFMDTKRKDFITMFLHHIFTIILLTYSWTTNVFRIGTLISVIHDINDIFLEAGKLAKYAKYQRVADACFVVFVVVWIISRLFLFPCRIIYSVLFEAPLITHLSPSYYICTSLLFALQVLHIMWTWMIIKVALHAVSSKNLAAKDLRSDSDDITSSSTENEAGANHTSSQSNNATSKQTS